MTVGRNIRAVRRQRGLTLEELSGLCGVSRDELGQYERGEITPRAGTVQKIAQALEVPIVAIRDGMGWSEPQAAESWETAWDDRLLYDGILENLRESYGAVDLEDSPQADRRFLVGAPGAGFTLEESDIQALVDSVRASIPALIEYMKDTRPETVVNSEILRELDIPLEDDEEALVRRWALTDGEWEQLRDLLPPEKGGRGRAFKSNRLMLDGILFWMKSGRAWQDLPACFGRYKCVSDRLRLWSRTGVWEPVLQRMEEMGILHET